MGLKGEGEGKGKRRRNDEKGAGDERKNSMRRGREKIGMQREATRKIQD